MDNGFLKITGLEWSLSNTDFSSLEIVFSISLEFDAIWINESFATQMKVCRFAFISSSVSLISLL